MLGVGLDPRSNQGLQGFRGFIGVTYNVVDGVWSSHCLEHDSLFHGYFHGGDGIFC